jgi:hypothetical protein
MTSTGRLLEGAIKGRDGLAPALEEVLAAYAKLPEAERRAQTVEGEIKPQPLPPPNGLVVTIYDRPLGRDGKGPQTPGVRPYHLPEGDDFGGLRTHAPHGQRSSLWFKEEEWKSLIPSDPHVGQSHKVSTKLAKRIFLYGLVPQSLWVVEESWKPNSVREGDLHATVLEATAQTLHVRLHGSVLLTGPGILHTWPDHKFIKNIENRYDARLEGIIEFDRAKNKITRLDLAAVGDFTGRWFAGNRGWIEATAAVPLPLGLAFELDQTAYDLPLERRRPRSFVHAYLFQNHEDHYWDPDQWLADWQKRQKK